MGSERPVADFRMTELDAKKRSSDASTVFALLATEYC